ncbi:MAG: hypothetical protein ACYC7E_00665 [Armatimonadota bacterium]
MLEKSKLARLALSKNDGATEPVPVIAEFAHVMENTKQTHFHRLPKISLTMTLRNEANASPARALFFKTNPFSTFDVLTTSRQFTFSKRSQS